MKFWLPLLLVAALLPACGTRRKANEVSRRQLSASLQLPKQADYLPEYADVKAPRRDTIRVTDLDDSDEGRSGRAKRGNGGCGNAGCRHGDCALS